MISEQFPRNEWSHTQSGAAASPKRSEGSPTPVTPDSCCEGAAGDNRAARRCRVKPPAAAKYFCPMCPGVESDQPGECPKCGMALERNPLWKPAAKTIYTCPMHPEIEQDQPGDCPICGMALEPKSVTGGAGGRRRIARYDPALLDRGGADASALPARDGSHDSRRRTGSSRHSDFVIRHSPAASRAGFNLGSPRRWCCGRAGLSLRAVLGLSSPGG